jgi:signal transduction histidine kinase
MFLKTLSGRFLLLTIIFVMLAEVMIFVPSVARFREDYLRERLERSQIASLTLLASPDDMVSDDLRKELLANADVLNIVLRRDAVRELVLSAPMPHPVDLAIDLRATTPWSLIQGAFDTMVNGSDRVILVTGEPVKGGGVLIEATMAEKPLKQAMLAYGNRIFWLSLGLSLAIASMFFFAIRILIGRPINRVVRQIQRFQSAPEDARQIVVPSSKVTEFYKTETALADMETQLNMSLLERKRLVALGGAVSKISHDLRNILTTTQLLADSMEMSKDPRVQRIAPKLVNSLSRAVNLCERTLSFGKAEEAEPILADVSGLKLIEDVIEAERLAIGDANVKMAVKCPKSLVIWADEEQLFRVISNLARNARQVLMARPDGGDIIIEAREEDGKSYITVSDTGPGLPAKARENMFKPFEGSVRAGGTGLGLAISAELIANHDGVLEMVDSSEDGTTFQITLPRP